MGTAACLFVYAIGVRLHRAGGTGRLQRIQNHVQQLGRIQLAFGAAFRKIRCEGRVGGYVRNKGQLPAIGQGHRLDAVAHITAQLRCFKRLFYNLIPDQAQRPPLRRSVHGGKPAGLPYILSLNKFPLFMQHNAAGGKCRRTVCSGFGVCRCRNVHRWAKGAKICLKKRPAGRFSTAGR